MRTSFEQHILAQHFYIWQALLEIGKENFSRFLGPQTPGTFILQQQYTWTHLYARVWCFWNTLTLVIGWLDNWPMVEQDIINIPIDEQSLGSEELWLVEYSSLLNMCLCLNGRLFGIDWVIYTRKENYLILTEYTHQ